MSSRMALARTCCNSLFLSEQYQEAVQNSSYAEGAYQPRAARTAEISPLPGHENRRLRWRECGLLSRYRGEGRSDGTDGQYGLFRTNGSACPPPMASFVSKGNGFALLSISGAMIASAGMDPGFPPVKWVERRLHV